MGTSRTPEDIRWGIYYAERSRDEARRQIHEMTSQEAQLTTKVEELYVELEAREQEKRDGREDSEPTAGA